MTAMGTTRRSRRRAFQRLSQAVEQASVKLTVAETRGEGPFHYQSVHGIEPKFDDGVIHSDDVG